MKTPKKTPRRRSAAGKTSSKPEGTSRSGLRWTNGYGRVGNERATFAGQVLKGPGKFITGEEAELSEDELAVATVGVEPPSIRQALNDRGRMMGTIFANQDGATEPVKRKLESGVDGESIHGECTYEEMEFVVQDLVADGVVGIGDLLLSSPKRMKVEKPRSVINSEDLVPQHPTINGISSPVSIRTPLSPQQYGQEVVTGRGAGVGTGHDNAPSDQQVPPAEGSVDPVIGQTLHARYHILGALGRGNFSKTYLAQDLPPEPEPPDPGSSRTGTLVAVKRVDGPWLNPMGQTEYENLHNLHLYDSPRHIVKPLFAFFDQEYIFHLVLEPLDSARPVSLPEGCACVPSCMQRCKSILACPGRQYLFQKLMVQMLSGIHELHRHGLIHSDLTPMNILYLPESNRIKIIDLGNVIKIDDPPLEGEAQFEVQSAHYRAPEILLGAGPLGRKIDVWGAGVVGLEWLLGKEGRKELETEIKLMGKGSGVDIDSVWQPIMAVPAPTRKALVTRMATLFGSVGSYRQGVFWRDEYDALDRTPAGTAEMDEWGLAVPQENHGILSRFLLNTTLSPGLTEFMGKMLQVDVWQRETSAGVLRNDWLVKGLLGEWASVLLRDVTNHRVGMAREVVDIVLEGAITSDEEAWVEAMDDSGFAESAPSVDGKEMEADGKKPRIKDTKGNITPTDGLAGEDPGEESSRLHCNHSHIATTPEVVLPTKPLTRLSPTADEVAQSSKQPAPPTPHRNTTTTKRFDDIPSDGDGGLPFLSPNNFPFTYTRFHPSPSPPLPRLFQSPSPEPLPAPFPGQLAQIEGGEVVEDLPMNIASAADSALAADFGATACLNEEAAHDAQQQLQEGIQPKVTPLLVEGLASWHEFPHPPTILDETQTEVMSQEQPPILMSESDSIKGPDLNVWHMDLAIGPQVILPLSNGFLIANQVNREATRTMRMTTKFVCYDTAYLGLSIFFLHTTCVFS